MFIQTYWYFVQSELACKETETGPYVASACFIRVTAELPEGITV